MATILGAILSKSAHSISFFALAFRNGLEYRNSDFRTWWLRRVKIWWTSVSISGVYEGRWRTPLVDQQFSYVRLAAPLLDPVTLWQLVLCFVDDQYSDFVSRIR